MATTRGQVRAATDLVAKRKLQKLDGVDVIFEASGSLASGKVTIAVPLSASAGLAVSGAAGLIVNQGGVTISGGDLRLNNNVIKSSGGSTAITLNSTDVKTEGDLIVGAGHIKVGTNTEAIILDASTGRADFQGGVRITGSTTTSGSLTIGGNSNVDVTGGRLTVQGPTSYGVVKVISQGSDGEANISFRSTNVSDGNSGQFAIGVNQALSETGAFGLWNAANANVYPVYVPTNGKVGISIARNSSETPEFDLDVRGDARITNGLIVTGSTQLANLTASAISSSGRLDIGNIYVQNNLEVSGNLTVRGTPTIINSDVLEVKDNIIVINKISGSDATYDSGSGGLYVNRGNAETASLLWVSSSNDWQLQATTGGTPASADLVVNKLKPVLISSSAGVAVNSSLTIAATASLHTSGAFSNLSIATSSVTVEGTTYKTFNLDTAFHAIDSAMANAGLSATDVQNAYRRLRYQVSGTLDANGEASIALPTASLGADAFPTTQLDWVKVDVMIDESGRWINDLVAIDMEVSGSPSQIYVTISAAAAPNTGYRLIAVNENTGSFAI